ncbi:UNVERIFIED_CONTAM: hypothetical protein Sradi_2331100 [Sesamum radiatum]|uniref:Uncharacterized protein n=1 Tax=Sesamum radiatum TaxID=300843 RepID=A0AAW2T5M7_SESRA
MGFRGLEEFNLALLAKQGWIILSRPEALLSRILKARYFRIGTFWEANVGRRPSLTWRSILRGRPLLEEGNQWVEGLGDEEGRWRWRLHRRGWFTVRSAYKHARTMRARKLASSSGSNSNGQSKIWALSYIPCRCLSGWTQGTEEWIQQVVEEVSAVKIS